MPLAPTVCPLVGTLTFPFNASLPSDAAKPRTLSRRSRIRGYSFDANQSRMRPLRCCNPYNTGITGVEESLTKLLPKPIDKPIPDQRRWHRSIRSAETPAATTLGGDSYRE